MWHLRITFTYWFLYFVVIWFDFDINFRSFYQTQPKKGETNNSTRHPNINSIKSSNSIVFKIWNRSILGLGVIYWNLHGFCVIFCLFRHVFVLMWTFLVTVKVSVYNTNKGRNQMNLEYCESGRFFFFIPAEEIRRKCFSAVVYCFRSSFPILLAVLAQSIIISFQTSIAFNWVWNICSVLLFSLSFHVLFFLSRHFFLVCVTFP